MNIGNCKLRNAGGRAFLLVACLLLGSRLLAQTQLEEPKDNMDGVKSFDISLNKVFDVEMKKDAVTYYKKAGTIAHTKYEYDTNGNEILQNYYHQETGKVQESYVYEYDNNNRRISELYVVQGVAFGGKVTYSYNKQGKIEQRISYSNKNEQQANLVYRYDSLGNLTAEQTYNTVYMVIKELQYKYDERGNRIEKRGVKSPYFGGINFVESYSYDDFNRLIGKEYYSENDSLNWRYSAKYDAKSRLVEEETKDGTGKPISYATYTYDKDGKLLSSYNYDIVQKTPPMRIEHEYNKQGQNTVRYIYVQGAKTPTITKRYYYDEKGNWIMWYEHNHVENEHVIVNRKITYF